MTPRLNEMFELEQRFATWTVAEQVNFLERLLRRMRRDSFTDHEALARDAEEMANDPDMQRVLNNLDLGPNNAAW